jgi:hypothetical protein
LQAADLMVRSASPGSALALSGARLILKIVKLVMPGLVPGIHVLALLYERKTWMAGTGPAMTKLSVKLVR